MNNSEIIYFIDQSIFRIQEYIDSWKLHEGHQLKKDFLKVLTLMKADININGFIVNKRLLRGFKDICTITAIQYELTEFNDPIFKIYYVIEKTIPQFKDLELLGMDYGKGDPI